jgi:cytochrome c-type biogenesis protein CcmH
MKWVALIFLFSFVLVNADENKNTQERIRNLSEKIRCLVCQNQSLADSPAELAVDLRRQVVEQVKAGRTDQQILDYMVERYGDFVLYDPPLKATTALLWIGPFVLLVVAGAALVAILRRRRTSAQALPLGPADRRVVDEALRK